MWSQYAEKHKGIAFGIPSNLNRVIKDKGRFLQQVEYPPANERPHTPFNNPKLDDVRHVLWTSSRRSFALHRANKETDILQSGEIAEIIYGWDYEGEKERWMRTKIFQTTHFFDSAPCATHYRMSLRQIQRPPGASE
jgi:hypothetical protein